MSLKISIFHVLKSMIGDVIILDPLNDSTIATCKHNLYLLNLLIKKKIKKCWEKLEIANFRTLEKSLALLQKSI